MTTPLLQVSGLRKAFPVRRGAGRREVVAVDDVSFALAVDSCLAIVGESGSGKTTCARIVAGLEHATGGTVTVDGQNREERGYTVVAANSGYYGYGLHIAPDAAVDDGLLDVVILRHAPRRLFFAVMRELPHGTHVRRPHIEVLRGREVRVEADREIPVGGDGELIGTLPATIRVLPGALKIIAF